MRLAILLPELASRDCEICKKYEFDDEGILLYRGLPIARTKRTPPACETRSGCPKGTPREPLSLTPENALCYQHYLRCKAVGKFPEDSVVAYNAKIISEVERECSGIDVDEWLERRRLERSPGWRPVSDV